MYHDSCAQICKRFHARLIKRGHCVFCCLFFSLGVCKNLWNITIRLLRRVQNNGLGRSGGTCCLPIAERKTSVLGSPEGMHFKPGINLTFLSYLFFIKPLLSYFRTRLIVWKTLDSGGQFLNLETFTLVGQIQTWTLTTGHTNSHTYMKLGFCI